VGAITLLAIVSPINYFGIRRLDSVSAKLSAIKDRRIERITEVLSNMMIIKVFCWEDVFEQKIWKLRSKELGYVKKFQYAIAVLMFVIMNTCE
jgi:ABC-type multidrug transport system fused ATPase/permease subunit